MRGKNFFPAALILAFYLLFSPPGSAGAADGSLLRVTDAKGAEIYSACIPASAGFAIRYTHSVALTPVVDYFQLRNGKIMLDRTVYEDFGAGLPHQTEGDQKMRTEKGKITISGYNRQLGELGEFTLRVGRVAGHALLVENQPGMIEEIALASLAAPGSAITFAAGAPCETASPH